MEDDINSEDEWNNIALLCDGIEEAHRVSRTVPSVLTPPIPAPVPAPAFAPVAAPASDYPRVAAFNAPLNAVRSTKPWESHTVPQNGGLTSMRLGSTNVNGAPLHHQQLLGDVQMKPSSSGHATTLMDVSGPHSRRQPNRYPAPSLNLQPAHRPQQSFRYPRPPEQRPPVPTTTFAQQRNWQRGTAETIQAVPQHAHSIQAPPIFQPRRQRDVTAPVAQRRQTVPVPQAQLPNIQHRPMTNPRPMSGMQLGQTTSLLPSNVQNRWQRPHSEAPVTNVRPVQPPLPRTTPAHMQRTSGLSTGAVPQGQTTPQRPPQPPTSQAPAPQSQWQKPFPELLAGSARPQQTIPTQQASTTPSNDMATAGALENYKRKLRAVEAELAELRTRMSSKSNANIAELRRELQEAVKAQQRAEKRADFLELEMQSREEQRDYVEATQIMPGGTQQPSQHIPTQLATLGVSMSRLTPIRAKRRRSHPGPASTTRSTVSRATSPAKPPPAPSRTRRPISRQSDDDDDGPDDADWQVPNAAWLHQYDSPERESERVRVAVFSGARSRSLMALGARSGDAAMQRALCSALARSGTGVWARLHDALLDVHTAGVVAPAATRAASTILLRAGAPRGDAGERSRHLASEAASAQLAAGDEVTQSDREHALLQLAAAGGRAVATDQAVARAVHQELLRGSTGAAAAAARAASEVLRMNAGDTAQLNVEQLCAAALETVRRAGSRFVLDTMGLVERVAVMAPFETKQAAALLGLLSHELVGDRAVRVVAEFGAVSAHPSALMHALVVLSGLIERGSKGGRGGREIADRVVLDVARSRVVKEIVGWLRDGDKDQARLFDAP